jgi:DNA-directed RNA polymerase subunit beta
VRDVHATHYGRICPIETPEGPNIGLIASLSTFARVNEYGFVETPYRKVEGGKISRRDILLSRGGRIVTREHRARQLWRLRLEPQGSDVVISADDVTLMEVSPNQLVSVAASLIPSSGNGATARPGSSCSARRCR